MNDINFMDLRK